MTVPGIEWPQSHRRFKAGFGRPHLLRYLREWAADSAEREGWKDNDQGAYRFRRRTLLDATFTGRDADGAPGADGSYWLGHSLALRVWYWLHPERVPPDEPPSL